MVGFFSKKQYAAMANKELAIKLIIQNCKINIFFHFDENDKFNLYHKGNEYILYILCLEMDKSMWTDVFFCNG